MHSVLIYQAPVSIALDLCLLTPPPSDHTSLQCRLHVCPACGIRSPGHDSRHCPHPVTGASYTSHAGFSPTLRSPISEMEGTETLSHPQGRERLATLLEAARRSIATQGMLSTASDSAGPLGNRQMGPTMEDTDSDETKVDVH